MTQLRSVLAPEFGRLKRHLPLWAGDRLAIAARLKVL